MFLEPDDFPFVAPLREAWRTVRLELGRVERAAFLPYGQPGAHSGDWLVFPLVHTGASAGTAELAAATDVNRDGCPETVRLLAAIPGLQLAGFSLLGSGAHIFRHRDDPPSHRVHLGLRTNPGARLMSDGQVRPWIEGECLAFESGGVHEAVNEGDVDRVVLLLDVPVTTYPARPAPW